MIKINEILQGDTETSFNDKCYLDFKFWAERVFSLQIKDFHLEWMNQVHSNKFNVIKSFRGSGKTKILGIVYPLWLCYFRPGTHILFTASEIKQATKILDEVKDEIENNEFLHDLMPPNPSTWRQTELKMTNNSRIFCRAFTKSIKGVHVNYAFVDEVQDCTDRDIYYKGISPTVNKKKGTIVAVGAPDNPGDMLEELSHKPEYKVKSYPILKKPGVSMWPEVFSIEEITAIRKRDGEASFQTQYMMNSSVDTEDTVFSPEWVTNCFDYKEKFLDLPKYEDSVCIIGADFAISKGARADFDSYVVIEKVAGKSIIRWGERHKGLAKDAKIQRIEDLYKRYNPRRVIVDPSGIGEAIIQDLRNKGIPVESGEFHARARNKLLINLATMIQPDKSGTSQLVIPRDPEDSLTMTFTNKLVEELLSFIEQKSQSTNMTLIVSKGPHDDTVMSLALACKGSAEQKEFIDMIAF
jgi:phage terminase large subunit-like protein